MTIILDNYDALKNYVKTLDGKIDVIELIFDNEGMKSSMLDRAHILYLELLHDKSFFHTYNLDSPIKLTLDSGELNKVLQRGNKDSTLELIPSDTELELIFHGDYKKRFVLRLIDDTYESPNPPEIDYPTTVEVTLNELLQSFDDANIIEDKCTLTLNDDNVEVSVNGDFGDYKGSILITDIDGEGNNFKSVYNLDYLKLLKNFAKLNNNVSLRFGDSMPLTATIESVMGDTEVTFLLAPRIEHDEE